MEIKKDKTIWDKEFRIHRWGFHFHFFRIKYRASSETYQWDCLFFLSFGFGRAVDRFHSKALYFAFDALRFNKPQVQPALIRFVKYFEDSSL